MKRMYICVSLSSFLIIYNVYLYYKIYSYNDLTKIKYSKLFNYKSLFIDSVYKYNKHIQELNTVYKKFKKCKGNKNAIIVLLTLIEIKCFIYNNIKFLKRKYYDILIFFVTENITKNEGIYLGIEYKLYDVSNSFNKFPYEFNPIKTNPNFRKRGKWNYQHMCRFFFRDIFILPELCNVRYFMRLDSQSYLNSSINLFPNKKSNVVYVHNVALPDVYYVVKGLKEFTLSIIEILNIKIKDRERYNIMFNKTVMTYNNNLEIGDMMFFRRRDVFEFINLVDLSYGQFIYRWGDAPLRYVCLTLYAEHSSVISFPDNIIYYHRPFLIFGKTFTYSYNYNISL